MLSLDTDGELFALDDAAFRPFLYLVDPLSEEEWEIYCQQADVLLEEREEYESAVRHENGQVWLLPEEEDFFLGCRVIGAAAVAVAGRARWSGSGGRTLSSVAVEYPPEHLTPDRLGNQADISTLAAWQGILATIGFPCPALGVPPRPFWLAGYEDDHVGLLTPEWVVQVADGFSEASLGQAIESLGIQGCEAEDVRRVWKFLGRAAAAGHWVLGAQAAT
ncbi:MAG: hypothetical protein NW237_02045 [Cyanobacteriota bacterium]|nr:hypothetical protein [Cyanobacteriota bacterium]